MGFTLTDPNTLVNLPPFGRKGEGQYFYKRNRGLNALCCGKLKLRLGIKKLNAKIFY